MTDTSAILASLDRFIERFARHGELINGHRLATQYQPVAIAKPLTNQGNNHSGHSGHPKQEAFAGVDHERCGSHSRSAEHSGWGLARKVSSVDGYSGKSGKSLSNQEVDDGHRGNTDGRSGRSPSDQQLASGLKGTSDQAGPEPAPYSDASRLDPTSWSDLYEERAAHRQFDGGNPRVEAELLAWRDIEWRWHLAHRERASAEVCAGCDQLIRADEALDLIDGARVHMRGCRCRIAYEQRWRRAATNALAALGLQPPGPIGISTRSPGVRS
jgi:hypothetical protein